MPIDAVMRGGGCGGGVRRLSGCRSKKIALAIALRSVSAVWARARRFRAGQDDDELVAAVAGEQRGGRGVLGQQARHLLQRPTPRHVPEAIVDGLEVVEVDEKHRQLGPVVIGVGDLVLQAHVEVAAVEQTRQVVETGLRARAKSVERVLDRRRHVRREDAQSSLSRGV